MTARLMRVPKLDLIYRSMTIGHFACLKAGAPIFPAMPHELNQPAAEESWKSAFGWSSFPYYDKTWSTALDKAAPTGRTHAGGRVVYLNVTEVTGQRIDAHDMCVRAWALLIRAAARR